eukprot:COSAG05_NODE_18926_length_300_cov_1.288557_1_plen_81_part_10
MEDLSRHVMQLVADRDKALADLKAKEAEVEAMKLRGVAPAGSGVAPAPALPVVTPLTLPRAAPEPETAVGATTPQSAMRQA